MSLTIPQLDTIRELATLHGAHIASITVHPYSGAATLTERLDHRTSHIVEADGVVSYWGAR